LIGAEDLTIICERVSTVKEWMKRIGNRCSSSNVKINTYSAILEELARSFPRRGIGIAESC
jgi:hypothetical protein